MYLFDRIMMLDPLSALPEYGVRHQRLQALSVASETVFMVFKPADMASRLAADDGKSKTRNALVLRQLLAS